MGLVVVGSGAAGLAAVERLRELGKEVALVSRDRRAHSLCTLPYVLSGELEEERVYTHDEPSLRKLGVEPFLGHEAVKVDAQRALLELGDGSSLEYEALLIATGSLPHIPPIPGIEPLLERPTPERAHERPPPHPRPAPPLYTLNSMEDARRLASASERASSALVLGAGLTGLACACALRRRGLDVTVVEMEGWVLPRTLDPDMSPPVEETLAGGGVGLRLGARVVGVSARGGAVNVRVRARGGGEERLEAGIVVLCLGVRPDLSLARSAGLMTGLGVVVGSDMRSSDPRIFAAGDVAEFSGRIPATWPTAFRQGEVAALNMAGLESRFSELDSVTAATFFGLPVFAVGATASHLEAGAACGESGGVCTELWRRGGAWRKLVTRGGEVVGCQSVGAPSLRGLPSLLGRRVDYLAERFIELGIHSPMLSCLALSGGAGLGRGKRLRVRGRRR